MLAKLGDWYASSFGHALVGAIVLWAALAPLDLWPLAWVAPVWWVLLVRREDLPGRRPYLALWLVGLLFWLATLHWLAIPNLYTALGGLAMSLVLAFCLPLFIGLSRVAVHRVRVPVILAAPVVWTGLELARGHLLTGFSMASLGHSQYRWITLIQLSDLAGAYGVSFVVMFVAASLARISPAGTQPRAYWPLVPLVVVVGAAILYGQLRISRALQPSPARIALIQGSIDTVLSPERGTRARMRRQYRELSEQATARYGDLDLIVWPESAFGGYLFDYDPDVPVPEDWQGREKKFRSGLEQLAAESRKPMRELTERLETPILIGLTTCFLDAEGEKSFNSAVFVPRGGGPLGRYDKMHLVMFGEYVPLAKELSWLVRLTPLNSLNLLTEPGREPAAFEVAGLRIAPNICYESVMPHVIRRQVVRLAQQGREPDLLVNLTNDGWFFGSAGLDMHLACGVFRAVECRKPFLIAANTGFSAWIDGDGRILAQGPRRATGVILAEVGRDGRRSWYLAHGDWPAGICLAACLVLAAVPAWQRLRGGPPGRTAGDGRGAKGPMGRRKR